MPFIFPYSVNFDSDSTRTAPVVNTGPFADVKSLLVVRYLIFNCFFIDKRIVCSQLLVRYFFKRFIFDVIRQNDNICGSSHGIKWTQCLLVVQWGKDFQGVFQKLRLKINVRSIFFVTSLCWSGDNISLVLSDRIFQLRWCWWLSQGVLRQQSPTSIRSIFWLLIS